MAIELDHTIVPAGGPQVSAQFLAGILGLRSSDSARPSSSDRLP